MTRLFLNKLYGWVGGAVVFFGEGNRGVEAGEVLVVGDSLSKEYRSEFAVLYPGHPAAWGARNWVETLEAERPGQFDQGDWKTFLDWRLTGHEFNWSKPGGTVREFRNFLRQTADAQAEVLASSGGAALWSQYPAWRTTFTGNLGQVEKVVIFLGGNDVVQGNSDPVANPLVGEVRVALDYAAIYNNTYGDAANASDLAASIRSNIKSIIDWFRVPRTGFAARYTGPMVLCAVPHVGCTPKVQAEVGREAEGTGRVTQMLESLNRDLQAHAVSRDVGFADVYAVTKQMLEPGVFRIGGVEFLKEADVDCGARYLFSGDGFHPNTAAQAKLAQVVVEAFRSKYPEVALSLPRLGDREILTKVLGLPGDVGYVEWMEAEGIAVAERGPLSDPDGDGMANALEYALAGRRPGVAESGAAFTAERVPHPLVPGEALQVRWQARFGENAYCDLVAEVSRDLQSWQAAGGVSVLPDGTSEVLLDLLEGEPQYVRLAARRP